MIKKITALLVCTTLFLSVFAQDPLIDFKVDVVYLASDMLEGRETGTKGERMAAEYIAKRFEEVGLKPKGQKNSWYHTFSFNFKENPHVEGGEARQGMNVIGFLDNGAKTTVVIGGHYDHLGYGLFGSRHTGEPAIHNGADDNASGIAALFYLAEQLKASKLKQNNYLFIAFSGEELGLIGSKKYAADPTISLTEMNYMLNLDMVGRLNEEKVVSINGVGTSPAWKPALEKLDVAGIKIKTTDSGIGPSDHTSFYLKDVPAIHFFSGQHPDYHKPEDDPSTLNYQGIKDISDYILALIAALNKSGELEFTKTKDESQGRTAAKFKVTLGVMPDYVYDGKGMRIDGVLDGRPAQAADMKDGDVILKIGDIEVKDIYDYMEGLSKFKKGQKAIVVVKRGEDIIEKEVEF